MNIACLCATFGRPHLVANQISTFLSQSYSSDNRRLLILDDGDQISGEGPGWKIVSVKDRFSTMPNKYAAMIDILNDWWPEWEAITIMDDDDIYGPDWLKGHAQALKRAKWSHPKQIMSLYGVTDIQIQPPKVESSNNRFWSSSAVSKELFFAAGGFFASDAKSFDVDYICAWGAIGGNPADSNVYGIQFCYGWGRSNHDSYKQSNNKTWNPSIDKMNPYPHTDLQPSMDSTTQTLWNTVWKKEKNNRLTIGMAVYEDFDGVYFTLQALRYYHQDVDPSRIEYIVIDNCPNGTHAPHIKNFVEQYVKNGRYIPNDDVKGTAVRDFIFDEARTELVLCLDSHVLVEPGAIRALLQYYEDHPDSDDLIQGPLVLDDIYNMYTHFDPRWQGGMFGVWAADPRANNKNGEAFDIPAQGLGLFSCRKSAWLGFNRKFSGFGGEEFYIHEKFRQAGRRALCLPALRWIHRFVRPTGTPYRNVWEDRIRNYIIGWKEIGRPIDDIVEHFSDIIGKDKVLAVVAAVDKEFEGVTHDYCV